MGRDFDQPATHNLAETSALPAECGETKTLHYASGPPHLDLPATIGRYTIVSKIGEGGFGSVYLARDGALEREVAIKITSPGKRHHEARTLARLDHPAIVPVFDIGALPSGETYIIAKYVCGSSLAQRLEAGPLSAQDAAQIIARVCDGLQHAHAQRIYHRDIKPANILLDESGAALVADFGLAIMEQEQSTARGEISGSPGYMSPEQIRGDADLLDGRSDIWSAGVVLYEALTGERPFTAPSRQETFDLIRRKDPKPLRLIDPAIPEPLERIVLRCLRKSVADRYATAADVAGDLRAWLATSSATPAGSLSWSRMVLVAGVALLVLAAFIGSKFIAGQSENERPRANNASDLAPVPLSGQISLRIWSPDNDARRGRRLEDPGMLPLHIADQIRVEAELSRPAYAYILWIDGQGKVSPVYPWKPGRWNERPAEEVKVSRVSLPEQQDIGWEMEPSQGMETLLLIARDEPLPAAVDLRGLLDELPPPARQDPRALAWFDNGRAVTEQLRAPRYFDPKKIDDPVVATHQALRERLTPISTALRAVTFASPSN